MSALQISLFGSMRIAHHGQPYTGPITRAVQALLGYVLLHRHQPQPRPVLAGLFWGDVPEPQARKRLNTTLWRVRQVLEPPGFAHGTYLITTPAGDIHFNTASDYVLDVAQFEAAARHGLAAPAAPLAASAIAALEEAVSLYTGELLTGLYDDWALRERERLHRLYLDCLTLLMHHSQHQGATEHSLAYGHRILEQEPWREEVHRLLMQLYLERGQRGQALRQYETCQRVLQDELGVTPMAETQALYVQAAAHPTPTAAPPASLTHTLDQLRLAQQHLTVTRAQLDQALDLIARLARRQDSE